MDRHDRLPGRFSFKILQIQLKSPYRIPIGNPLGFWDFPSFSSTRGSWSALRPRNLHHVFKQSKLVIKTCPWRIFDKMVTRRKNGLEKVGVTRFPDGRPGWLQSRKSRNFSIFKHSRIMVSATPPQLTARFRAVQSD